MVMPAALESARLINDLGVFAIVGTVAMNPSSPTSATV